MDVIRCSALFLCLVGVLSAQERPWIVRGQDGELHVGEVPSLPPARPVAAPVETESETPAATAKLPASVPLDGATGGEDEPPEEPQSYESALVYSYVPGSGDHFGWFAVEGRNAPAPDLPQAGILSMPSAWGITWLNGPRSMDLPPQLYHLSLDIGGISRVNDRWTLDCGIAPAWYSDWENRRPEAFRLLARAVAYYRIDPQTQVAAGFVYLDRDDIPALPVAGVVWDDATAGYHHELVFPRPRFSWRWKETLESSRWVYFASELGGGSWAIKRPDRTPDVLTIRDIQTVGGVEFRTTRGRRAAIEAGVLWARALESRTGIDDYSPPATGLLRLWFDY